MAMQIEMDERKFGDYIQLTLDDGTILTAQFDYDGSNLSSALRSLATSLDEHLAKTKPPV